MFQTELGPNNSAVSRTTSPIGGVVTSALLTLCLAITACDNEAQRDARSEAAAAQQAYREKYRRAEALFKERCKTAGLVVSRKVSDVEGIELTKIRQPIPWGGREYFDSMFPEAAMAGEVRGEDYVKQFMVYEYREPNQPTRRGQLGPLTLERKAKYVAARKGYSYVEYLDSSDGNRLRCLPDWSKNHPNWVAGQLRCEAVKNSMSRYALDYEDIVDPDDRALWVAGTRLKVIDKQTGEQIAELKVYVWDSGFGGGSSGRWPWQHASSRASQRCPSDESLPMHHDSRYFIDQVLIPKQ